MEDQELAHYISSVLSEETANGMIKECESSLERDGKYFLARVNQISAM